MAENLPLTRICKLLNASGARYLVCGAQACILHGLIRTTEDVDILVEATEENCQAVIDAIAKLEDGAARELTPRDILDNVVVKIADEVEVDVSTHAWKVSYREGLTGAQEALIDGVRVPFLGIDALMPVKKHIASRMQLID